MDESDPRSDVHYLGSSENKAWKKFQACTRIRECSLMSLLYRGIYVSQSGDHILGIMLAMSAI